MSKFVTNPSAKSPAGTRKDNPDRFELPLGKLDIITDLVALKDLVVESLVGRKPESGSFV